MNLNGLELSIRTINCLANRGCKTLQDVAVLDEAVLLKTKNFGRKSLKEVKLALRDNGLRLGMTQEELDGKVMCSLCREWMSPAAVSTHECQLPPHKVEENRRREILRLRKQIAELESELGAVEATSEPEMRPLLSGRLYNALVGLSRHRRLALAVRFGGCAEVADALRSLSTNLTERRRMVLNMPGIGSDGCDELRKVLENAGYSVLPPPVVRRACPTCGKHHTAFPGEFPWDEEE